MPEPTIPAAAIEAAADALHEWRRAGNVLHDRRREHEGAALVSIAAALPHLIDDEMVKRVRHALHTEFASWIIAHPQASLFDWNVAAHNALTAAFAEEPR